MHASVLMTADHTLTLLPAYQKEYEKHTRELEKLKTETATIQAIMAPSHLTLSRAAEKTKQTFFHQMTQAAQFIERYLSLQERLQQLTEQLVPVTVFNAEPHIYTPLISAPELSQENKKRFLKATQVYLDLNLYNFSLIDPKRTQEMTTTLVKAARLYITLLPQFQLHSSQLTALRATIQELDLSCPGRPSVAYTPPPLSLPKKSCERKIPSSQNKLLKSIESFHKLKPIIEIALDPWGSRTQEDVIINPGSTQLRMRASLRDSLEPNPRFRQYRTITPYYKMLREYCLILPQIEARCPPVGEEIGRIIETMTQLDPCLGRESQKTLTAWRDTYTTLHGESPIFRPSHPFWPEIQTLYARYKREYESYCCC